MRMKRVTHTFSERCMAGCFGMVVKHRRFGRIYFLKPSVSCLLISMSFLAHPFSHPGLSRLGLAIERGVLGTFFQRRFMKAHLREQHYIITQWTQE